MKVLLLDYGSPMHTNFFLCILIDVCRITECSTVEHISKSSKL